MKKILILILLILCQVAFAQRTRVNPTLPGTTGKSGKILRVNGTTAEWTDPTKAMIGLQNVPNVDATNPANLAQSPTYRLVSDSEKNTWNANKIAANVSALKTMQGASNDKINLLGYYTKGDGGGQEMYWDAGSTATDNGGTIIQVTGVTTGRWVSVKAGLLNIKQFGAIADSTTDNTDIFQKALNAGNIYIPVGIYKISGTISIPSNRIIEAEKGTTLVGTIIAEGIGGGYPNTMFTNADTTAGNANITFNNIKFDFYKRTRNYVPGTSVNSLKFKNVTNLHFNNCEFFDFVTNYNSNLVGTKYQLKFGMAFFDNCTNVSLRNIKTSKIREEGLNFYECSSITVDNWIADGSVVNTSSHAGFWYCEGVSIKNCKFTHTGGSVLNVCASNVVIENIRVNEGSTQAGRGIDFGNELQVRSFNANNISLTNSYFNVKEYGLQNPSFPLTMAVENFTVKNNTFIIGVNDSKCSGIFLRGALYSVIEGNTIKLDSVSIANIGRCVAVVPYSNQTMASAVRNNKMFGNCAVELYYADSARINNLEVQGNVFTSQGIGAMSSLTGNSAFFYFRNTSSHTDPYYLNNVDIASNTTYNVGGSFVLMNLDVAASVMLRSFSVTKNYFYGTTGSLAARSMLIGGTGIGGNPLVSISNNVILNGNSVALFGLSKLRMHNNTFTYVTALADHRVKLYAHNGSVLFHNNTFDNVSTSGSYSDLKQMSASTYTVVQNSSNFSYRTDNSIGFTTDLPANSASVVGKLNVLATGSAASSGTATLVGGTVTINTTAVTASSKIFVTRNTRGGTIGAGYEVPASSRTAGTSFVIRAIDSAGTLITTETSTVDWWIIN